ncbi:MAG: hypothetical protein DI570_06095 [Phenylobacterium zucineum]|nr:MAG: hypothetical protein DI570_06095 [Phenylobacterium zucineum]
MPAGVAGHAGPAAGTRRGAARRLGGGPRAGRPVPAPGRTARTPGRSGVSAPSLRPQVLEDDGAIGEAAADRILTGLAEAVRQGRAYVLGCPAGRSPRTTYAALARRVAARQLDLSRLHLVMMDEYVLREPDGWSLCPRDAHYSCMGFGEREIRQALNAGLPPSRHVPPGRLHGPDPGDPAGYDRLIGRLGGVDVFLLASGASDGHVAFNPPGTPLEARTQLVELAESTRRDNLGTFPQFEGLDAVPRWGVSISPGSIMRLSRAALLLLPGEGRATALRRVAVGWDPSWPASIIHLCQNPAILTDRAAWAAMETA